MSPVTCHPVIRRSGLVNKQERRRPRTGSPPILFFGCGGCKPNSVSPLQGRRPFLWDVRRRTPQATYPRIITPRPGTLRLFGLAAGGVCHASRVTPAAVRSYRTISPLLELVFGVWCWVFSVWCAVKQHCQKPNTNTKYQTLNTKHQLKRYLSVALSVGLLRLEVIKRRGLCSSDFPHLNADERIEARPPRPPQPIRVYRTSGVLNTS